MQIQIVALGEVKTSNFLAVEAEYIKRFKKYTRIEIQQLPTKKLASLTESERKKIEAKYLLDKIGPDDYLIILDEKGKILSSKQFASMIEKHMLESTKRLVLAVGGVFGWDASVFKRANLVLSLSTMTFTFELARLVLVEQVYRAFTIIKGVPYHKD